MSVKTMCLRLTIHETNRCGKRRLARRLTVGGALVVVGLLALMSIAHGAQASPSPEAIGRAALIDALAPVVASRGAVAAVHVAPLDPRRVLAPCARMIGFVPPGARLVGKTLVGVRCLEGATWQTFLTADIRVEAPVWQTTHALRAGDTLGAADLKAAQALLTAADVEAASATNSQSPQARGLASIDGRAPAPLGRIVQRPVAMGRALAASDLREPGHVNPGDPVRVVYKGAGFSVSSEGRSVGAADPGANLLIRLESGSLVNGTLLADHRVELPH